MSETRCLIERDFGSATDRKRFEFSRNDRRERVVHVLANVALLPSDVIFRKMLAGYRCRDRVRQLAGR